jgi:malonyl-CoA/methylmalonyl-CoA synthetase
MLKIFQNASQNLQKIAILSNNQSYTYDDLLIKSNEFAAVLLENQADLNEMRVAFMVSPSFDYVKTQWAIWQAGGVAVPLCITYPLPSLQYVIEDTEAQIIVADETYFEFIKPLAEQKGIRLISTNEIHQKQKKLPKINPARRAMILYTSGTTNLPKGVVTTHLNIQSQVSTLVNAWKWTTQDHIICVLPLHHVHGIINVISCALWSGATVEFLPSFSAELVFEAFFKGKINVFMAVPTIYFKLISYWESLDESSQKKITDCLSKFRLMVSGSAALPVTVMEKWKLISNHTLLERYGMTEIGMGISNPYDAERKAGYIGKALKGVKVRLVDENNHVVKRGQAGEIQIKGANVFKEYWNKPDATAKTFTEDGWFKTGDVAVVEKGYYRILGRDSIDIIKSGGYKISALEIEEVLRTHPEIKDCSVVGIPNEEWGELVAAVLIVENKSLDLKDLNTWLRERMPAYKTPRTYKIIEELPRNAMGKVTKNDLKALF